MIPTIRRLATGTYTINRTAAGVFAAGLYTPGAASTVTGVTMMIQPISSRDKQNLMALSEGQHHENTRRVYTEEQLFSRAPGQEPDTITIGTETWTVIAVERWEYRGGTYYTAFIALQDNP